MMASWPHCGTQATWLTGIVTPRPCQYLGLPAGTPRVLVAERNFDSAESARECVPWRTVLGGAWLRCHRPMSRLCHGAQRLARERYGSARDFSLRGHGASATMRALHHHDSSEAD